MSIRGYQITRPLGNGVTLKVINDETHTRDFIGMVMQGNRCLGIYGITETPFCFEVYLRESKIAEVARLSEAVIYIAKHFKGER